jgi:outer membrane lipoprotein SlyB
MKRITTLTLAVALIALSFTGCSNTGTAANNQKSPSNGNHHDSTGGSQGAGDLSTRGARGPQ